MILSISDVGEDIGIKTLFASTKRRQKFVSGENGEKRTTWMSLWVESKSWAQQPLHSSSVKGNGSESGTAAQSDLFASVIYSPRFGKQPKGAGTAQSTPNVLVACGGTSCLLCRKAGKSDCEVRTLVQLCGESSHLFWWRYNAGPARENFRCILISIVMT